MRLKRTGLVANRVNKWGGVPIVRRIIEDYNVGDSLDIHEIAQRYGLSARRSSESLRKLYSRGCLTREIVTRTGFVGSQIKYLYKLVSKGNPFREYRKPTTREKILFKFQGRSFTSADVASELGISRENAGVSLRDLLDQGIIEGELVESDPQLDLFDDYTRTAKGCGKIMEYTVVNESAIDDIEGTFLDEETRRYLDTLRPLVGVV